MLIRLIQKYYLWILFLLSSVAFYTYYQQVFSSNFDSEIKEIQSTFLKLETQLQSFTESKHDQFHIRGLNKLELTEPRNDKFMFHQYHQDTLVYWNTNQLPIIKFANIHFPTQGMIHAQNGWYYSYLQQDGDHTYCGTFLIRNDFPYENEDLKNDFGPLFPISLNAEISINEDEGSAIYNYKGDYLFSVVPAETVFADANQSLILFLLLSFSVCIFIYASARQVLRFKSNWNWFFPIGLILIQWLSIHENWFGFMSTTDGFQPSLYGSNDLFPNFFAYFINVFILFILIYFIAKKLRKVKPFSFGKPIGVLYFLSSYGIWVLVLFLSKGLIENSSISLSIEELFSLNFYSVMAIVSLGFLGISLFIFLRSSIQFCVNQGLTGSFIPVLSFVTGIIYFLIEINLGYILFFSGLFPLFFFGLTIYYVSRRNDKNQIIIGLGLLAVYSFVTAINLTEFNRRKEKVERKFYANQLLTEKDVLTEVEFSSLAPKIAEDKYIQKIIDADIQLTPREFEEGMEHRHFNGYWERYEVNFQLFNSQHESKIIIKDNSSDIYAELDNILSRHGEVSDIDSNLYFIGDYTGQYSYVIRMPITTKKGNQGVLFCTLKSKKIPEEIGFPRLLISSDAKVFDHLEKYSVARYHNDRLVTKYGRFNYPTSVDALKEANPDGYSNFDHQGYNHFLLYKTGQDVIVLSGKNVTWIDILTSFSYLFSFFGLLMLPLFFELNSNSLFKQTISLAAKIQLVLIGLVFVSLLAFGWGSGIFITNQYNEYTNDVISEKLGSIETELQSKLGKTNALDINNDGVYVGQLLQKFAKVFVTDINLYDKEGYLLATSRPKVFNMGLLSEQMNPSAKRELIYLDKSEYIHQEHIGDLAYSSAYHPFYNNDGGLLGYINLQHFGQQEDFEYQIERFFVAIINVFMLLLAVSIVLAIFVSNWVTTPLRLLQENFSNIRFGKYNQKISYKKNDEIGALVKDYNSKLEELEYTAQQLAQSERESAWREMAKQVAHEIKNPLTPMKLSVQQLLRTYDPEDPRSRQKLEKVVGSLIEQIDSLTTIANEFSNFAKMPKPNEERLELNHILSNVVEVFQQGEDLPIEYKADDTYFIQADKDQMIRVFNNLIKNAIQATDEVEDAQISISLTRQDNNALIKISDNGVGITKEQRAKIFNPYFTTKSTGTGIGLSMVKQIVENHKGDIYFESTPQVGTTFFMTLPLSENEIDN